MRHLLERVTHLKQPLTKVFAFFEDPRNLARITPPSLSFSVVNPDSVAMRAGAEIDYTIRWMGLPMKWRTLITAYEPPHMFADEQASGPYKYWHHVHTFEEEPGGVLMRDRVEYELPLGILGELAHALLVRRQLNRIFDFREQAFRRLL